MSVTTEESDRKLGAYSSANKDLRINRELWRVRERDLMAARDAALRALVGNQRGGVTRAARALGLSDAQILRLLDDGITRAVVSALEAADVERSDYQLTHQRGGRSIGVVLVDGRYVSEDLVVQALGEAGLRLVERRSVSTSNTGSLRWQELKRTKALAQGALADAEISPRTYRLVERRGDRAVRLTLTQVMDGLATSARERFGEVLRDAGLVVEDGDDGVLLVSSPVSGDDQMVQELLFRWDD